MQVFVCNDKTEEIDRVKIVDDQYSIELVDHGVIQDNDIMQATSVGIYDEDGSGVILDMNNYQTPSIERFDADGKHFFIVRYIQKQTATPQEKTQSELDYMTIMNGMEVR